MAAEKKTSKRKVWLIAGAAFVVLVVGVGIWYFTRPSAMPDMASRVMTAQVTRSDLEQTVSLSGTLSPVQQADLSFSVSGEVTKVFVKVGDEVKKGDKLAQVDAADLENAVDLAKANLKSAKASYSEAKSGSTATKNAAKARVDSAQAALDSAEQDVDDAVLRSTIDGTVAQIAVEVGDQIGSGGGNGAANQPSSDSGSTAQVVVIATAKWKLQGTVSAADLPSIKTDQVAQVTLDSSSEPVAGKVIEVGLVAESVSDGTAGFLVTVELDGEHPELYSGISADAAVAVASAAGVLSVPTAAVNTVDGQAQVTLSVNGEQQTQAVTLGKVYGENTEILEGLNEGDEVVVSFRFATNTDEEGGFGFGGMGGRSGMGGGVPPNMGGGGGVVVSSGEGGPNR